MTSSSNVCGRPAGGQGKTLQIRTTVYFDPALYRALRLKAVETNRSLSDIVNEAVKLCLAEDAEDMAAFAERGIEPNLLFEDVLKELKRSGKMLGLC